MPWGIISRRLAELGDVVDDFKGQPGLFLQGVEERLVHEAAHDQETVGRARSVGMQDFPGGIDQGTGFRAEDATLASAAFKRIVDVQNQMIRGDAPAFQEVEFKVGLVLGVTHQAPDNGTVTCGRRSARSGKCCPGILRRDCSL